MTTQQIAWTIDNRGCLAIIYPNYQTAVYTAEWNILDLTVSTADTIMVLTDEFGKIEQDGEMIVYHSKQVFPMEWVKTKLSLGEGKQVIRIDAAPDDTLYMVLNTGEVAKVALPKEDSSAAIEIVKGVENAIRVSAASDGLVWVVCSDPDLGSIVKWMDPAKGKWNRVPELSNASNVTGGPGGKAYIINSAGELAHYTKKGVKTEIRSEFDPAALSIGPDGRLWVLSTGKEENDPAYWTDDDGENWSEVPGSNGTKLDAGKIDSDFNQ